MLRYEVYLDNRLTAMFQVWRDASEYAEKCCVATVIDFDQETVWYFENDQIISAKLPCAEN